MPEGGKLTPISPGIIARVGQAARYVINGVTPSTWFGPLDPLQPMAPAEVKGRQFDYPTGYNLNYTPRSSEAISFADLRALADNCDILRSVIETRKDQMEAQEWSIRPRASDTDKRQAVTGAQQKRIDAITEFFQSPDREHTWEQWLRILLEDMFVIDAACLYRRPNRKGELYGLDIIDGASIKILADADGRRPVAPNPAYQQILKGIPAADYSTDELLYLKHNPRSYKFYGYSHVEQVLVSVNILIRRSLHQLEYYREGSIPDAFLMAPAGWTTDQIKAFQSYVDGLLSGNSAQRRKLRILPETKFQETKPPVLKDEYDEFLARIVCFVFSLPPTAFVKQQNRATADSAKEQAQEEGLVPLQNFVRNFMNRILAEDFESPDLEFAWKDNKETDPKVSSDIRVQEVKAGIMSIDEAREDSGLDQLGGAYATPMPLVATGFVAVKSPEEQQAASDAAREAQSAALAARVGQNSKQGDEHGGGEDSGESSNGEAAKVLKGVKKKTNPYLPMTERKR